MKFLIIKTNNRNFVFEIEKIYNLTMQKGISDISIVYDNGNKYREMICFDFSKIQDIKFSYHNPNEDNAEWVLNKFLINYPIKIKTL